MEIERRLQKNASLIREGALVVLGAGIQTFFSLGVIRQLTSSVLNGTPKFVWGDIPFVIGYISITFLFSVIASLAFTPEKRLISPVIIQMLTFVFTGLIISEAFVQSTALVPNQPTTFGIQTNLAFFSLLLLYLGILFAIGESQFLILRTLVGLNGTDADLEIKTYSFDSDFKNMSRAMLDKTFRGISSLRVKKEQPDLFLLSSYEYNVGEKLVFCVSSDPVDSSKSILTTVAYRAGFQSIMKTPLASALMESNLLYIEKRVGAKSEYRGPNEPTTISVATSHSLKRTRSTLKTLREIPPFQKAAVVVTSSLIGIFSLAYFISKIISETDYIGAVVLIVVALIVELGPTVSESVVKASESAI